MSKWPLEKEIHISEEKDKIDTSLLRGKKEEEEEEAFRAKIKSSYIVL